MITDIVAGLFGAVFLLMLIAGVLIPATGDVRCIDGYVPMTNRVYLGFTVSYTCVPGSEPR